MTEVYDRKSFLMNETFLITDYGAHEDVKQSWEEKVKAGGAWQAVEWNIWWNAERHENSSQSFVEADPQGNRQSDVKSVEMR